MTDDISRAIAGLRTYCIESDPRSNEVKHHILSDIRQRELLSVEILRKYPTLYLGSNLDIHFPLALGCRKIHLLDPSFIDGGQIAQVIDFIEEVIKSPGNAAISAGAIRFKFDFGEGDEIVEVRPLAAELQPDEATVLSTDSWRRLVLQITSEAQKQARPYFTPHFAPPYLADEPLGMLLGYATLGVRFDLNQRVLDALVPGGFLLNVPMTFEGLDMTSELGEAFVKMADIDSWADGMERMYREQGRFDFIRFAHPLPDHRARYSFLRKRR